MARRLIATQTGIGSLSHLCAKVYRDAEWQEWRVTFYRDGIKQIDADYHTGDKQDAMDTATAFVAPKSATVSLVSLFCSVALPHDAHVSAYRAICKTVRKISGQAFKALMAANREGRAYSHTDTRRLIAHRVQYRPQDVYARAQVTYKIPGSCPPVPCTVHDKRHTQAVHIASEFMGTGARLQQFMAAYQCCADFNIEDMGTMDAPEYLPAGAMHQFEGEGKTNVQFTAGREQS